MPATNEPFSVSESWERIYVFKTKDLADDIERATTASQNVTKLDRFVRAVRDGLQQADAIRGLLLSDPQIEQAVRRSAGRDAEDWWSPQLNWRCPLQGAINRGTPSSLCRAACGTFAGPGADSCCSVVPKCNGCPQQVVD